MRVVRCSYRPDHSTTQHPPIVTRLSLQRLEPSTLTEIQPWHAFSDAVLTSQDMMKNMPASLTPNDEAKRPNPTLSCNIDPSSTHPLRHTESVLKTLSNDLFDMPDYCLYACVSVLAHCPRGYMEPPLSPHHAKPRS